MRQKKSWEISEEELLKREQAYLKEFTLFERLVDNHVYYIMIMILSTPLWFMIGLAIGALIAR